MAVIRVNKTSDYTVMSNYHLKDRQLSLKAKGLLSLILSLPDDWNYTIGGLVAICLEKESAVKSALSELKDGGYLEINKIAPNKENGGRYEYIYNIYEQPREKQKKEFQEVEKQPLEIQQIENNPLYKRTNKSNTNKSNTNKSNKDNNSGNVSCDDTTDDTPYAKPNIEEEFETLWKLYPRKLGKTNALKAYTKARKKADIFDLVKTGIENYKNQIKREKIKTEFIKHGSTWFNNECWNDEYGDDSNGQNNGNNAEVGQPAWSGLWL